MSEEMIFDLPNKQETFYKGSIIDEYNEILDKLDAVIVSMITMLNQE